MQRILEWGSNTPFFVNYANRLGQFTKVNKFQNIKSFHVGFKKCQIYLINRFGFYT